MDRRQAMAALLTTAASAALGSGAAYAQATDFPRRPVRIVSPFGAGGSSDVIARILSVPLQQAFGQGVIVENRPGAGSNIGTGAVARSDPDGYTLLLTTSGFVANPSLYAKIPYDPVASFAPVADLADAPNILVATPQSGLKGMADLFARAKAQPGVLNCATAGVGTTPHLALELLKLRAGLDIVHVGFAGGGPATTAALSGTTELFFSALPNVLEHIAGGLLVPIGIASAQRWPTLPQVSTFIEAGLKDFVTDTIHILLAPAGTPPEIVGRISGTTLSILGRPEIRDRIQALGYRIVAGGPDVLAARIAREVPFYREIVTSAKLPVIQ